MEPKGRMKPGDKFRGELDVARELGGGYTGVVYEVHNPFTRQSYALKLMHEANEHQVSRLSAEATALIRIEHKNVVRVQDAGQLPDGRGWLLMELLKGRTLGAMLAAQGALSPLLAIRYVLGIAWGVDAAHELGVIHRDLKPDNIFIVEPGNVPKVLDFSGAKHLRGELRTTKPPDVTGTVAYMSPEHIDGQTADGRIDVYSLGLIFWEMLKGTHPFQKYLLNIHRLALAQATEMPALVAAELGLPSCFDEVIQKATAKEPADRYQTPADFAQAVLDAKRRLLAEVEAGRVKLEKRPGEPSLHDADTRQEYQAPQPVTRPDTAPVQPAERITIAPRARSEAPAPEVRASSGDPAPGNALGPAGTVRLSQVGLDAHARRVAEERGAETAPVSKVQPERRVRPAPTRSHVARTERLTQPAAGAEGPASEVPGEHRASPASFTADTNKIAPVRRRPFAWRTWTDRLRFGLLHLVAAALAASLAGSVAVFRRMRHPSAVHAQEAPRLAPAPVTLVPDPLPIVPIVTASPAASAELPRLPPALPPAPVPSAAPAASPAPTVAPVAPVATAPHPAPPRTAERKAPVTSPVPTASAAASTALPSAAVSAAQPVTPPKAAHRTFSVED
jgi:eukaryotic-like serine/threonine-protein kinase